MSSVRLDLVVFDPWKRRSNCWNGALRWTLACVGDYYDSVYQVTDSCHRGTCNRNESSAGSLRI